MRTEIVDQSNNNAVLTPLDNLVGYCHKISEGVTFYDKYAGSRLAAAKSLTYRIGYHVIRLHSGTGVEQANWYLECCKRANFDVAAQGCFTMNDWEGWSDGFATPYQSDGFHDTINAKIGREAVIVYGGLPNPYRMGNNIWLADYRSTAPTQNPLFPNTAVWQWGNKADGGGDTNQIINQSWLNHLAGYDQPTKEIKEMSDFRHNKIGEVFQIDHGYKYPMPSGDYFYSVLRGTLYPETSGLVISYPADDAMLAAVPNHPAPNTTVPPHSHSVTGTAS